ncbi:NAD(P)-dependent oxidoreductase [Sphingomonas oligophenolica]|uniref:NAD(P)-dependent oxidoreductase n=1 Tax=Sphingomonas oligophenolica TaxID=301154 RepID=A0ABU9Y970_9SPHN
MDKVAFVGLGGMGGAMAGRLVQSFPLILYDLDSARATALAGTNGTAVGKLSDALPAGGVLITMLPDDRAVRAVVDGSDGARALLGRGGLHINMSTVSPAMSRDLGAAYADAGADYVAAPVWGRPDMAGSGKLVCALAGPAAAKVRALPYLHALAARIEDFGIDPGLANVAKVMGNFLVAAAIEALGEAMAVAQKHGLDREQLAALLTETVFDCPVYRLYGGLVARQRRVPPGFTARLGHKDLALVRAVATEVDAAMPFQNIIENRLLTSIARGRDAEDWSALSWVAAEDAGLARPVTT